MEKEIKKFIRESTKRIILIIINRIIFEDSMFIDSDLNTWEKVEFIYNNLL